MLAEPGHKKMKLQICRLILEAAASEGILDGPAVLITTTDARLETFQSAFSKWIDRFACDRRYDKETHRDFLDVASDHLRDWFIIRRMEVHFVATSMLAAIVRRNVRHAQALLFGSGRPPNDRSNRWENDIDVRGVPSRGVRLVIDGLGTLKHTYPNIVSDPLFLPSLRFYVNREKLTALVVATQKGRPDEAGDDPFERETLNLFLHQIRTWRVQFFGDLRVAISVLPPAGPYGSATVRELTARPDGELQILPHFELYRGLHTGQPQPVPLEIRLTGDTQMIQTYRTTLNALFSELFPAVPSAAPGDGVVRGSADGGWTYQLRDFGRLHRDTRREHTLVIQVDEYWSFQRSDAFRPRWRYLFTDWHDEEGLHESDPLEVFGRTWADSAPPVRSRRFDRFVWNGYFQKKPEDYTEDERDAVDRVPFMWDFGFLLCNRDAWLRAKDQRLFIADKSYQLASRAGKSITVEMVWNSLRMAPMTSGDSAFPGRESNVTRNRLPDSSGIPLSSWRFFMEAATVAATQRAMGTHAPAPAFDLPVRRGESLSCLVLEMWASEVFEKFRQKDVTRRLLRWHFERFTHRSWLPRRTLGLIGLMSEPEGRGSLQQIFAKALAQGKLPKLARHSIDLFKVLMLLRETLALDSLIAEADPFHLKSRPVNPNAVCARHWYPTACEFLGGTQLADQFVPVRLPGHFSVRGDSYLAVARGSHSGLLGDRAIDILSSGRGNYERLRAGIGLPVRDLADPETGANPRTRLTFVDGNGRRSWIRYRALISLGADDTPAEDSTEPEEFPEFNWLWRSTLGDYDAQARAFHHGMTRLMDWLNGLRDVRGTDWKSGFDLYDAIDRYYAVPEDSAERREIFEKNFAVYSLWEFPEICDEIIDRLKRATPRH